MEPISPGLAGHKGLRGEILLELKKDQPLTASELAGTFSVSANAIRRHLKELEAEGLVVYGREQRNQPGAPTFAYRLSDAGERLFPNRYEDALTRLLQYLVDHDGRGAAVAVLQEQYAELRGRLNGDLEALNETQRTQEVARVLCDAGYMAECVEQDGETRLKIHNCAIRAAASCLPEVCQSEVNFLESVVEAPVERRSYIMDGCNSCEYVIRSQPPAPPAA